MTGYVVGEIFVWIMIVSFVISFCYAIYETATYFDDINRLKKLFRETARLFRRLFGNKFTIWIFA